MEIVTDTFTRVFFHLDVVPRAYCLTFASFPFIQSQDTFQILRLYLKCASVSYYHPRPHLAKFFVPHESARCKQSQSIPLTI